MTVRERAYWASLAGYRFAMMSDK